MKTQVLKFKDMPFLFQKSIIIYGGEDGIVDWSVVPAWATANTVDWNDDENIQIWIDDYIEVYGDREFRIGEIDTEKLKERIVKNPTFCYDSFEEYYEWYNDDTDHGDSVFPIVVSEQNDEYIEDGWHRFHSYIRKGMKKIPFVEYLTENAKRSYV